jgi:hypothetical protein
MTEFPPPDRRPHDIPVPRTEHNPSTMFHYDGTPGSVTTITYSVEPSPRAFNFAHDSAKGVYVLTKPDGTTERFRDKPARYLVVEPDPGTGEHRPATKRGLPVYLYLCREDREA